MLLSIEIMIAPPSMPTPSCMSTRMVRAGSTWRNTARATSISARTPSALATMLALVVDSGGTELSITSITEARHNEPLVVQMGVKFSQVNWDVWMISMQACDSFRCGDQT